jgi:Tripartite tricarboxylate transporter family receptor
MSSMMPRRWLLAAAIALSLPAHASTQSWAQSWPTKSIRLVVPLTAGSATDVMSRLVMDQVSAQLAQPIIVENRPGAGNTIGMSAVAKADPDGYTILANSSTHTVTPATRSNLGFEMTDLAAVIPLGNMPVVLVVNPSKGYKQLGDFVAAAKARPGTVNYASAGAGNSSHLNGERFRLAAGFEAVHLPFKGAPEALTEVVAGRAGKDLAGDSRAVTCRDCQGACASRHPPEAQRAWSRSDAFDVGAIRSAGASRDRDQHATGEGRRHQSELRAVKNWLAAQRPVDQTAADKLWAWPRADPLR